MKAILLCEFGGPEQLVFEDVEAPPPGPNQVLIKVAATSVNRPDIVQRQGNYAPPKGDSDILGLEVAGTVEQLGEGVVEWQVGQRVMALIGGGGYAQYAVAYTGHMMAIPECMSYHQAACICETYITAYLNLFLLAKLENHGSALIHGGGGGVNTAAIQICRQLVPDVVLFVTASSKKVDRVKELGVHHVIDYSQVSFAEQVKLLTKRRGVDVVLDHIGAKYLSDNMQSLAVSGRLIIIGVTSGIKAELNLALLMVKRQQIIGSVLRSRSVEEKSDIINGFKQDVLPLLASGKITPLVDQVFQLSDAASAHRMMESSEHFGKIVLAV